MLMKPERFDRLITLSSREGLPIHVYLIMMRRALRHIITEDELERLDMRQNVRAFRRSLPFSQFALDKYIDACRALQKHNREPLLMYGRYLRDHHQVIELELGWERLCDVLCVNPTHRMEAAATEKGLFGITWIGGQFEDSATHYGSKITGQGPMTRAVSAAMTDWMLNNMDKLPDPFAPGGPLYGVPTYTMQPDGSMVRNQPTLTVHNADGTSKIVKRGGGSGRG